MKALIILASIFSSQISLACMPEIGAFIPSTMVEVSKEELTEKTGIFKKIKDFTLLQGRIMNMDMALPAIEINLGRNNEQNIQLAIESSEIVGCNVMKYTARTENSQFLEGAETIVEILDYTNSPCMFSRSGVEISLKHFDFGHTLTGKLSGFGNRENVFTIQSCLQ